MSIGMFIGAAGAAAIWGISEYIQRGIIRKRASEAPPPVTADSLGTKLSGEAAERFRAKMDKRYAKAVKRREQRENMAAAEEDLPPTSG